VTIDPASGGAGEYVTVTGTGFAASQTAGAFTFSQAGLSTTTTFSTDGSGGFAQTLQIPAGAVSGSLAVTSTIAGTAKAAYYTVTDRPLVLSKASGPKGTLLTVAAAGMSASGEVDPNGQVTNVTGSNGSLTIGGVNMLANNAATTGDYSAVGISIDSGGNMATTTVAIPTGSGLGDQLMIAQSYITGPTIGTAAAATFNVTKPTFAINPSSGYMGDTVSITGAGWVPGSRGVVTIGCTGCTSLTTNPAADGTIQASIAIPTTGGVGPRVITFTAADNMVNTAVSQTFTVVRPELTVDPTTAAALDTVTVSGQGFTPSSPVTSVTIAGATVTTTPATPITDVLGSFDLTFVVPGLTGVQTISASVLTDTRTTFLTITEAAATVAGALANISNELVIVWYYNSASGDWQLYDPADPIGSDLTSLTDGEGYWIKVTEAVTIVYLGKVRNIAPDAGGWDMFGW
jgi:hypothetical protein